jgi:hypothetical protein
LARKESVSNLESTEFRSRIQWIPISRYSSQLSKLSVQRLKH